MRARRRCLLLLVWMALALSSSLAAPPPLAAQTAPADALAPLPKGCGGGLPPGEAEGACCLFGYVIRNGVPLSGAEVIIRNLSKPETAPLRTYTASDRSGEPPSFGVTLSGSPLFVEPGHTIRITATVAGLSQSVEHTVLSGGQQIDVVLPQSGNGEFVLERDFLDNTPPGTFALWRGDIALDHRGNSYITDTDNSRVQVFSPNGFYLYHWGGLGYNPGQFATPVGIAIADDRLYVADLGRRDIQVFSLGGDSLATWPSVGRLTDVAAGIDGFIYATVEAQTASDIPQVLKYARDGRLERAWGLLGAGDAQLNNPTGITQAPDGSIYVVDSGNRRVSVFTATGAPLRRFSLPTFSLPERIAISATGAIIVSDASDSNSRLLVYDANGVFQRQIGGPRPDLASPCGSALPLGQLCNPSGLALDAAGNLYVADTTNQRIQVFSAQGVAERQFGQEGEAPGKFFGPDGIVVDETGKLYVVDSRRHRVRSYGPDANVPLLTFGGFGNAPGKLNEPGDIARDSAGNLIVADRLNHRVQYFTDQGQYLRSVGRFGTADGQFNRAEGVLIDATDNLYVVDIYNHRIQKFDSTGRHLWTLGRQVDGAPATGNALGEFNEPRRMAIDSQGFLYVADTLNHRVQKISPDGQALLTLSRALSEGERLPLISTVAVDANDNVYAGDFWSGWLERYTTDGDFLGFWGGDQNPYLMGGQVDVTIGADGRFYMASRIAQRVQVVRSDTYAPPIATIIAATPRLVTAGETVQLYGRGAAGVIPAPNLTYEWYLGSSGQPFATTANATLDTSDLPGGVAEVTLRVRAGDQVSAPKTIRIDVVASRAWTFMLYLAGDNPDIAAYLNRADNGALARLGRLYQDRAPAQSAVVALYDGPEHGDSELWLFDQSGVRLVRSRVEERMDEPETLAGFIAEAQRLAPAQHYYLAIANHGNALDGIAWDQQSNPENTAFLTNPELKQALAIATENGLRPIAVLHLDACLMGLVEVSYQFRGLVGHMVVSQSIAWSFFGYDQYLREVRADTDPASLATQVARRYQQAVAGRYPYTIAALDMAAVDPLVEAVDNLAGALLTQLANDPEAAATLLSIRAQVQKLDSNGDLRITEHDQYVDLGHFAERVAAAFDVPAITTAAAQVQTMLATRAVRYNASASATYGGSRVDLDHARGLGIYFPDRAAGRVFRSYRTDLDLAATTQWDEMLRELYPWFAELTPEDEAPELVAPQPFTPSTTIFLPYVRR